MFQSLRRIGKEVKDSVKIRIEHFKLTKTKLDVLNDMDQRIANAETETERKEVMKEKEEFLAGIEKANSRAQANYDYHRKKQVKK